MTFIVERSNLDFSLIIIGGYKAETQFLVTFFLPLDPSCIQLRSFSTSLRMKPGTTFPATVSVCDLVCLTIGSSKSHDTKGTVGVQVVGVFGAPSMSKEIKAYSTHTVVGLGRRDGTADTRDS
jgi:hypothetical protein